MFSAFVSCHNLVQVFYVKIIFVCVAVDYIYISDVSAKNQDYKKHSFIIIVYGRKKCQTRPTQQQQCTTGRPSAETFLSCTSAHVYCICNFMESCKQKQPKKGLIFFMMVRFYAFWLGEKKIAFFPPLRFFFFAGGKIS